MSKAERFDRLGEAFRPAAPIRDADFLAGRRDHLLDLQAVCRSPGAHAIIFGERGVGKSSVAAVLQELLSSQGAVAIRINCGPSDEFGDLWTAMFDEWASAIADESMQEILSLAQRSGLTQQSVVRTIRNLSDQRRVVFIFDEFDSLANGFLAEEFSNVMKAISDHGLQVHIVIVGIADDVQDLLAGHKSLIRSLREIKLPRLSHGELRSILAKGVESAGIQLVPAVIDRIVKLSHGLPHYTHSLGYACGVRAIEDDREVVDMPDWQPALKATLRMAETSISELYITAVSDSPGGSIRAVLTACALARADAFGYFSVEDIRRQLELFNLAVPDDLMVILEDLTDSIRGCALSARDLPNGETAYRFAQPLLQPYVLVSALDHELIDDDILMSAAKDH